MFGICWHIDHVNVSFDCGVSMKSQILYLISITGHSRVRKVSHSHAKLLQRSSRCNPWYVVGEAVFISVLQSVPFLLMRIFIVTQKWHNIARTERMGATWLSTSVGIASVQKRVIAKILFCLFELHFMSKLQHVCSLHHNKLSHCGSYQLTIIVLQQMVLIVRSCCGKMEQRLCFTRESCLLISPSMP